MVDSTLLELVVVLGSATLVATLFHFLRIPTVVGFIATGMLIGPYSLRIVASIPGAQFLTEIAILFLMFTLGLEFSPRKVMRMKRAFLGAGMIQVLGTGTLFTALAHFGLDIALPKSIFIGGLVAMSSTAIVMKLLEDSREVHSPFGEACLGTLLFQDLAVIPLMLLVPLLAGTSPGGGHDTRWLMASPLLLAGLWFGGRFAIPWIFDRILLTRSREVFFFAVLSLCLGIAWAVERIGLSLSLGAFLAGLLVSDTPYVKQIAADIIHLRDNFLGLFFTSLGMLLDPAFVVAHPLFVLGIAAVLVLGKGGVIFMATRLAKYPTSVAGICAVTLAQVGEFSFVLATQGATQGLLVGDDLQYILSASVISILVTPFLFRAAPRWFLRGRAFTPAEGSRLPAVGSSPAQGHTIILGFGPVGQDVAQALKALGIPYRVLEMNPEIVRQFKAAGEDILYGDASQDGMLEAAGISRGKLVVLSVSGASMTRGALAAIRRVRPDIPVIVRAQYLREIEDLSLDANTEVVIAEFETSIGMLVRTLRSYGIAADQIEGFVTGLRGRLESRAKSLWGGPEILKLPSWEAISRIRPVHLTPASPSLGQSLAELRLRELTGANVVCVFREGLGTTVPGPDFVIQAGDVVHLIGSPDSLSSAEERLSGVSALAGKVG